VIVGQNQIEVLTFADDLNILRNSIEDIGRYRCINNITHYLYNIILTLLYYFLAIWVVFLIVSYTQVLKQPV
jgi:hypothetical protein